MPVVYNVNNGERFIASELKGGLMSIRFTKIKDGKVIYSQCDNEGIIRSCFNPCTILVRKKVEKFLGSNRCRRLTLSFEKWKVKLEKV